MHHRTASLFDDLVRTDMNNLLVILLAVPTAGAIVGSTLPSVKLAKGWALLVSLITVGVALLSLRTFDFSNPHVQLAFSSQSISAIGFGFRLGVDTISMWLVLLTVLLMPLAVAASFDS